MSPGKLSIQWLGHASLHIVTPSGTSIVVDPWFDGNPKFPGKAPQKADIVLCTHGHFDHTASVPAVAKKSKPQVVGIFELTAMFEKQGIENTVGMNIGGTYACKDVSATMVEARHSSSYEFDGKLRYAGNPAGYVLEIEGAPTLYLAGDTSVFSDMKLIAEMYRPHIAALPIGDHYTMGPRQAALAATMLLPKVILPIHWGTFPQLTGTPAKLRDEIDLRGGDAKVHEWQPGDIYEDRSR